jgi:hypothetical protein
MAGKANRRTIKPSFVAKRVTFGNPERANESGYTWEFGMALQDPFRRGWKHSNPRAREAAVEKLADQSTLVHVARTDRDGSVRRAAVEKLTDQALLVDIARTDSEGSVGRRRSGSLRTRPPL